MYYLQSRYYDPETGRFVNADGLVQTGQGVFDKNMYAYCLNDPVNMTDSTGSTPCSASCSFPDLQSHSVDTCRMLATQSSQSNNTTKAPSSNPSTYFKPKSETTIQGVDTRLLNRLQTMGEAYGVTSIIISEGFRSREQQQYFYDLYKSGKGNPANKPGYSWHEYGGAVDIVLWDSSLTNADFEKYGLSRPAMPKENWHIQIIENSSAGTNPSDGSAYFNSIDRWGY